ncbi:hypothetical protein NSK_002886 [Nannochloropsis salina CCMP1776]|uniref:YEATS domain-containing protein n=1 Tax=Nannochloropsis salina CCMP1776 TaxID=1027361 RepID=A0A4D9D3T8_9STRA|nr:hypothetical protein NSK_002886 [Nannochloropsis salina CCMP1776]|eukprot:TFJ86066.1 hypothetical protein NSK_002886 [Nannochloropsis salina CCMP1776]
MKGVTVCLPIAYGSIAWHMTKKTEQDQCTHQWTLYVRSPHGHDLGAVLKKTVFTLHSSFNNHIREASAHPFEVTEKGWGEFEALIDVYFKDAHEKSVELRHFVKLFHGNSATSQPNNKKPVVHEYYDEVVFTDPTEEFYQCLQHLGETKTHRHTLQDLFPLYSDVEDIRRIQAAHEFVTDQLRTAKDKLLRVESGAKALLEERNAASPASGPPPANGLPTAPVPASGAAPSTSAESTAPPRDALVSTSSGTTPTIRSQASVPSADPQAPPSTAPQPISTAQQVPSASN